MSRSSTQSCAQQRCRALTMLATPTRNTAIKSALPTTTAHSDGTCTATFPVYDWATDALAGHLTVQLEIVYLACVPAGPPPTTPYPSALPAPAPISTYATIPPLRIAPRHHAVLHKGGNSI
jgi:hypothetical protein